MATLGTNSELFEQLLAHKSITIKISKDDLPVLLNSLRVTKHRYDARSTELLGSPLSENKVIRHEVVSLNTSLDARTPVTVKLSLGPLIDYSKSYEIIEVES